MPTKKSTKYTVELELSEKEFSLLYLMLNQPSFKITRLLGDEVKDVEKLSYSLWSKLQQGAEETCSSQCNVILRK